MAIYEGGSAAAFSAWLGAKTKEQDELLSESVRSGFFGEMFSGILFKNLGALITLMARC